MDDIIYMTNAKVDWNGLVLHHNNGMYSIMLEDGRSLLSWHAVNGCLLASFALERSPCIGRNVNRAVNEMKSFILSYLPEEVITAVVLCQMS